MTFWATVIASGMATYLTRSLPLVITVGGTAPTAVSRYLDALPIAIIAGLAGAGIAVPDGQPTGGAEVLAALVIVLVAWSRRNLLLAVIAGIAAVAALRAIGL